MNKPVLPFLETMATQSCNLSCVGCTNYSDLPHKGYVSWSELRDQLVPWLDIIDIPDFGIMGGEPLLNPEIYDIVQGTRELMPDSQLRFTTNGLLLHKHPDIMEFMNHIGNVVFKITVHVENADLENHIKRIFKKYPWTPVTEFGVKRWYTGNGLRFQINRPEKFIKTYRGSYENMLPYESDPAKSFAACVQKTCPLLYGGRIYKCSTQGLLADTLQKFHNPNIDQWSPYLTSGIGPDSDMADIQKFIDNFGKPHAMCSMCPDKSAPESKIVHLLNVKKQKYGRIRRKIL